MKWQRCPGERFEIFMESGREKCFVGKMDCGQWAITFRLDGEYINLPDVQHPWNKHYKVAFPKFLDAVKFASSWIMRVNKRIK